MLMNSLHDDMIHINLTTIFYTHVQQSPTNAVYIKYYLKHKNNPQQNVGTMISYNKNECTLP